VLLLCSDGVRGPLADETPLLALAGRDAAKAVPQLLDRVESAAGCGRDNLSLIVLTWDEDARAPAAPAAKSWTQEDFSRTINTTHTRLHAKDPSP
jgi:serine/threonine protein phosphatase PrpC